ncbi:MAG: hypothetical protein AAGE43_00215 [Pseudomonadota bacterium]
MLNAVGKLGRLGRWLVLPVVLGFFGLGATALQAAGVADAPVGLKDQFGAVGGLATESVARQVAIVVSAKRLRRLKAWETALREIDAEVSIVRVADVPRTAPTEYERVAETLRKRLPPDVPVLIDLEGVWAATFELDVSVPTVLIFAADGSLQGRHAGMFRKSDFEALAADFQTEAQTEAHTEAHTEAKTEPAP